MQSTNYLHLCYGSIESPGGTKVREDDCDYYLDVDLVGRKKLYPGR